GGRSGGLTIVHAPERRTAAAASACAAGAASEASPGPFPRCVGKGQARSAGEGGCRSSRGPRLALPRGMTIDRTLKTALAGTAAAAGALAAYAFLVEPRWLQVTR